MKSLCFSIKNNQARAVLPRLQPRTVCSGWLRNAGALPTKILQADLWAVSEPVPVRRISGRRKSERLVNKIVIEIIYEFYKSINHIRVVSLGGLWYSERFYNLKFKKICIRYLFWNKYGTLIFVLSAWKSDFFYLSRSWRHTRLKIQNRLKSVRHP